MKVQTRLSLYSSITFGVIFAVISVLVYGLYYRNAEKTLYDNLKQISHITALFYLEEDELNKDEFAKVKKQFEEIVPNSYHQLYDELDSISYGSELLNIPPHILAKIRNEQKLAFTLEDHFCYGIYYEDNQGNFVIISWENKETLRGQLQPLLWILILAFIIGMLAIISLSRWIAHIAYRPFRVVIGQVKNISTNNLNVTIKMPHTQDELQDLITTFNDLLKKIAETFIIQKNFVRYVSHEFKTPLASIQGNLEVALIKDRSAEEYRLLSQKLITEINQLEEILDSLLIISDLRNNSQLVNVQTRIDELIWEIVAKLPERYSSAKVLVDINIIPEDENILAVNKDRTQLLMAFFNLLENAVKYSKGETVRVRLFKTDDSLYVTIKDKGIGIPANELEYINKPFFRADNANNIQGSGIGLSIALRILEKNEIRYIIRSEVNVGTEVEVIF